MRSLALLLTLCCLPAVAQMPTARLRDVHKVYVDNLNWRNAMIKRENKKFDGRKVSVPVGTCAGYSTSISGLLIVCGKTDADAELVTTLESHDANWVRSDPNRSTTCDSTIYTSRVTTDCSTYGGGVNRGTQTVAVAQAKLVLLSTGEILWTAERDNSANRLQAMGLAMQESGAQYVGGVEFAAYRVTKQLKHDYEASVKSR